MKNIEKHKTTKPPCFLTVKALNLSKASRHLVPAIIRKVCTFQVQRKKDQCWSRTAAEIQSDEAVEG